MARLGVAVRTRRGRRGSRATWVVVVNREPFAASTIDRPIVPARRGGGGGGGGGGRRAARAPCTTLLPIGLTIVAAGEGSGVSDSSAHCQNRCWE